MARNEPEAMGGFTLLLLSAIARDHGELPLKRVYPARSPGAT